MILRNLEGISAFDIRKDWAIDRRPGLSGLIRLREEATWCELAIRSFLPWCDELIIVVQPSEDRTREIVEIFRDDPKVKIFDYPYLCYPNGPGHDEYDPASIRSSSYYYNWTLAKSTRTHAVKLDGDMIMQDAAGDALRAAMLSGHNRISFYGIDLVGETVTDIGSHPRCPTDGIFLVTPSIEYRPGRFSERLYCGQAITYRLLEPAFVHLKWARKTIESQTKIWPENWRTIEHFRQLYARRLPVEAYAGPYPEALRKLLLMAHLYEPAKGKIYA